MKSLNKYKVVHDKWGKITKLSINNEKNAKNTKFIKIMSSKHLDRIFKDEATIDSFFIYDNKLHEKDSSIYLPKCDKVYSKISYSDNASDISLKLDKTNKLLKIKINYSAIRMFYDRRMLENFEFVTQEPLYFLIKQNKKIIKKISLPINKFLSNFETTIDLSFIKNLENLEFFTKKVFDTYSINTTCDGTFGELVEAEYSTARVIDARNAGSEFLVHGTSENNGSSSILPEPSPFSTVSQVEFKKVLEDLTLYGTSKDLNEIHAIEKVKASAKPQTITKYGKMDFYTITGNTIKYIKDINATNTIK